MNMVKSVRKFGISLQN